MENGLDIGDQRCHKCFVAQVAGDGLGIEIADEDAEKIGRVKDAIEYIEQNAGSKN